MSSVTTASDTSSVSEDEGEIPVETRARFGETLEKIRRRDASIYDKTTEFFDASSSSSEKETEPETQAPLYLKDVRAQQLLEFGAEAYSSSGKETEDEVEDGVVNGNVKRRRERFAYDEEQTENRRQLMSALDSGVGLDDSDDDGQQFGGLRKVERKQTEDTRLNPDMQKSKTAVKQHLDSYFAHLTDLKAEDAEFLKEYIEKEEWRVDQWGADETDEDDVEFEQDEEFLEEGAKFEADYNFRFEEPGSHQVVGHPRKLEDVMRTKESKRKRQRANKAERKQQEKMQENQETKEQKNRKRKEIQQKMAELNEVCGGEVHVDLLQELLDSDNEFDADKWDAKMDETFNEAYYTKDDDQFQLTAEERELEQRRTDRQMTFEREVVDIDEQEKGEQVHKQELGRLVKQYYALDREDTIDGVKCRYRYIKVPKENYGLAPHDVFCLEDKQLNEFVGLRRLNPYRDDLADYKYRQSAFHKLLREVNYYGTRSTHKQTEEANAGESPALELKAEEGDLERKIDQELDLNVRARLESYSHETLKPLSLQSKKRRESSNYKNPDKSSGKQLPSNVPVDGLPDFSGISKSQKKNIKRREKKSSCRPSSDLPT